MKVRSKLKFQKIVLSLFWIFVHPSDVFILILFNPVTYFIFFRFQEYVASRSFKEAQKVKISFSLLERKKTLKGKSRTKCLQVMMILTPNHTTDYRDKYFLLDINVGISISAKVSKSSKFSITKNNSRNFHIRQRLKLTENIGQYFSHMIIYSIEINQILGFELGLL